MLHRLNGEMWIGLSITGGSPVLHRLNGEGGWGCCFITGGGARATPTETARCGWGCLITGGGARATRDLKRRGHIQPSPLIGRDGAAFYFRTMAAA